MMVWEVKINPTKILLWPVAFVMVLAVWVFIVFFLSGIIMAFLQTNDAAVKCVYLYFSLPVSILLTIYYFIKRLDLIGSFIDANSN